MNLYRHLFTVNERPEDYVRHVNNLRYLEWFIEAAVQHADQLGWGVEVCKELGLAWVAASHTIEYRAPAYQDDVIEISTWIEKVTPVRITRRYECKRGDKTLCVGSSIWVLVDYNGERPRAIPKELKERFVQVALCKKDAD